jgi:hypothetical protein
MMIYAVFVIETNECCKAGCAVCVLLHALSVTRSEMLARVGEEREPIARKGKEEK